MDLFYTIKEIVPKMTKADHEKQKRIYISFKILMESIDSKLWKVYENAQSRIQQGETSHRDNVRSGENKINFIEYIQTVNKIIQTESDPILNFMDKYVSKKDMDEIKSTLIKEDRDTFKNKMETTNTSEVSPGEEHSKLSDRASNAIATLEENYYMKLPNVENSIKLVFDQKNHELRGLLEEEAKVEYRYYDACQRIKDYQIEEFSKIQPLMKSHLETLHSEIQANKTEISQIQDDLTQTVQPLQSKKAEITQCRQENERLDKEQKELKTERERDNGIFKSSYQILTKELRQALGNKKKIEKDMQAAEKEKAKLQEQLKEIEQSRYPAEGESSGPSRVSDQVMLGALEAMRQMQRQG